MTVYLVIEQVNGWNARHQFANRANVAVTRVGGQPPNEATLLTEIDKARHKMRLNTALQ